MSPRRRFSHRPISLACLAMSGVVLLPAVAAAQGPEKPIVRHEREAAEKSHGHLTPGEAARHAQRINGGGRVLSVSRGHEGYRVKLIKNGEVRVIFVPGK